MPPDGDRAEAQGDLASLRADIVMGPGNFGACPRVLKPLAAHADFASKLMEVVDIRRKHMAPELASPAMDCSVEVNRSEEHTSELQSLMRSSYAVFCLKKKKTPYLTAIELKDIEYTLTSETQRIHSLT